MGRTYRWSSDDPNYNKRDYRNSKKPNKKRTAIKQARKFRKQIQEAALQGNYDERGLYNM